MSVDAWTFRRAILELLLKTGWRIFVRPFASQTVETKILYWIVMGRQLNLVNPEDFNEKLQWLKLYWQQPLVSQCADQYNVREYVTEHGCGDVLNELYGVYDRTSEIPWGDLANKFALKCTHGCGYNIICVDKEKVSRRQSMISIERWMRTAFDF